MDSASRISPRAGFVLVTVSLLLVWSGAPALAQTQPETDNTVTRIEIADDESARWTVAIRTRLDTEESVTEFEAFQARLRSNRSAFLDPFRERISRVVANGQAATEREMVANEFGLETRIQEVPRRWGIVSYSFTWVNFAKVDGEALVVGDVFQGGFYLARNDSLVIDSPATYQIDSVEPTPVTSERGSVVWIGRQDFADGHPRVVMVPTVTTQSGTDVVSEPESTTDPAQMSPIQWWPWVLGVAAVLGIVAILWHRFRSSTGPSTTDPSGSSETIVTDEERVRRALEHEGGRMKQAAIAEEFGWTASKTSRVISTMVDEGSIEKLRIGRENVIELSDEHR